METPPQRRSTSAGPTTTTSVLHTVDRSRVPGFVRTLMDLSNSDRMLTTEPEPGSAGAEDVGGEQGAQLGGPPAGPAVADRGPPRPAAHQLDVLADGPHDLAADVACLGAREPGHHGAGQ